MPKRENLLQWLSVLLVVLCAQASAEISKSNQRSLELSGEWKFRIGDDMRWAEPELVDANWETIKVPGNWESQGYPDYNGYGWYRKKFVIPMEWQDKKLVLEMGRIDDDDETFFNGVRIGATKGVAFERRYLVFRDLVRWGRENLVAVRVYDGAQSGGMISPVSLKLVSAADLVRVETRSLPTDAATGWGGLRIQFTNVTEEPQIVKVNYQVYDYFQRVVASGRETVSLEAKGKIAKEIRFGIDMPNHYQLAIRWEVKNAEPSERTQYLLLDKVAGLRKRICLNGDWEVLPVSGNEFSFPPTGEWHKFGVPHFHQHSPFEQFKVHRCWYRRRFNIPNTFAGDKIVVRFGAVMFRAIVYCNGDKVGEHTEGYTPFEIDITEVAKIGQENELLVAVTDMTSIFREDVPESAYESPPGQMPSLSVLYPAYIYNIRSAGIWDDVFLISHPKVYISDVFIIPSVRQRNLTAHFSLANESQSPHSIIVSNIVYEGNLPVLKPGPREVFLKPEEKKSLQISILWEKPKLWFPENPHLYRLSTQIILRSEASKIMDELETRFGFREIWIDGIDFRLNGLIAKFRRASYMYQWRYANREEIRDYFIAQKSLGFNHIRFHGSPCPEFALEVADEVGITVINEGAFYCSGSYAMQDERFWGNLWEHWQGLVLRDRNHPSLIMYSIENEIMHCGHHQRVPEIPQRLYEVGMLIKKLDPTRPIQYDGDFDVNGKIETINIHYPYQVQSKTSFPNDAYWLLEKEPMPTNTYMGYWQWNKKKPLLLGEFCWDATCNPPQGLTQFIGDEAYVANQWIEGHKIALKMLCDAYRYSGVSCLNPWYFREDRGELMPPVHLMMREWNRTFFSGERTQRTIVVFNDIFEKSELILCWRLEEKSEPLKVFAQGTKKLVLSPGEIREWKIALEFPEVSRRTECQFVAELFRDKEKIDSLTKNYSVFPAKPVVVSPNLAIALYDPVGETEGAFRLLGIQHTKIGQISSEELSPYRVLVFGRHSVKGYMKDIIHILEEFVDKGNTVIVLEQSEQPTWLSLELHMDLKYSACMAYACAPDHPILRGIDSEDLKFWRNDNIVTEAAFIRPHQGNFKIIVESGGGSGLEWAPVLEIRQGRGRYILIQMLVSKKLVTEPVARLILQNCFEYAAQPPGPQRRFAFFAPSDTTLREALKAIKLRAEEFTSLEQLSSLSGKDNDVLIISGRDKETASLGDKYKEFVQEGGIVLVHGLEPETLEVFQKVLPIKVSLKSAGLSQVVRFGFDPLLSGLSNHDFYWRKGHWGDLRDQTEPVATLVDYICSFEGEAKILTNPIALTKIPYGKGFFIIDQLLWDKSIAKEPRKSFRIANALLSNLGATFSTEPERTKGLQYRTVDLGPFFNATLDTDLTGDKSPQAWRAEGENDLKGLPIGEHTLAGVPFNISNGLIILHSPEQAKNMPEAVRGIPINQKLKELYFLHACAWTAEQGESIARYIIHYIDGSLIEMPIIYGFSVSNWWQSEVANLPRAELGWSGKNPLHEPICLWVFTWVNPNPEKEIEAVDFVSNKAKAVPFLVAITTGS